MFIRNVKTHSTGADCGMQPVLQLHKIHARLKPRVYGFEIDNDTEQEIFNQNTRNSHKNINKTHIKITDKR